MATTVARPRHAEVATTPAVGGVQRRRAARPAAAFALLLLVVAGLMLWSQQRVAAPQPTSADPVAFSAERAMRHVDAIATETRFAGSPNHATTQQYIQAQLRAMGLRPQLQHTAVVNRFSEAADPEAGTVTNIIARIPGTASSGAIALNAHYDGAPGGPAASDCGSCVATLLETARAVRAGAPLRNDVLLVFTDAEENGDLGAAAFAGQSPIIRDVDVVLNWETAGSHGPSMLLGSNSSWLVKEVLAGAPQARTYSVLPSLFRGLFGAQQLNTDTQEYMDQGVAGVQFVYLRGQTDYHTVLDNTQRLGRGSLQMHGDYAVGLIRRLGGAQLARRTGDRSTYFNVTGGIIAQYGPTVAILLALVAAGLFVAALAAGLRHHRVTVRGLVAGVFAFPVVTLVTTLVAVFVWLGFKRAVPDLRVFSLGSDQNAFFVFGLVALAFAVFTALYQPLLRRARAENLALGALAWWVVLTVGFALAAPSAAYLWTWPTLAVAALALWRLTGKRPAAWRWSAGLAIPIAVLLVVFAPVMLIFTVLAFRLDGMGFPAIGVMGLFTALAAGLLIPHLRLRLPGRRGLLGSRWLAPAAAATLAAALFATGVARLSYDASFPRPDFISYVYNADTGRAAWEAGDTDSWTKPLLRNAKQADIELAPFETFAGWRAPALAVELAPPKVTRLSSTGDGDITTLRLRVASQRNADSVAVLFRAPGPIVAASVEGQPIPRTAAMSDGELKLPYVGLPRDGITLELKLRDRGTLRTALRDYTQGLPAAANAPRRPADTMPAPISFRADPTVVTSSTNIRF
jgi:MFS family permease